LGFTDVSENRSVKALSEHVFNFILKYDCEKNVPNVWRGSCYVGRYNRFDLKWNFCVLHKLVIAIEIISNKSQHLTHRWKRQRADHVSGDKNTNYRRIFFEMIDVINDKTKQ